MDVDISVLAIVNVSFAEIPKIEVDENSSSQIIRPKNQWKVEAKYKGYPKPKITWTKSGEPIDESKCKIYYDDGSTTVAIYSADRSDTGTYTVTATNSAGSTSTNIQLKIIGKNERINKEEVSEM